MKTAYPRDTKCLKAHRPTDARFAKSKTTANFPGGLHQRTQAKGIIRQHNILIRNPLGGYRQANFITENFPQKLYLPKIRENVKIEGTGKSSTKLHFSTNTKLQYNEFELQLMLWITPVVAYHQTRKSMVHAGIFQTIFPLLSTIFTYQGKFTYCWV